MVSRFAGPETSGWLTRSLTALRDSVTVEATNVSDFYFMGNDTETWYPLTDFPNIAPPFEKMWIEHHAPTHILSKVHGTTPWGEGRCALWGNLILSSVLPESYHGEVERVAPKEGIHVRMPGEQREAPLRLRGIKWISVIQTYMAFRDGSRLALPAPVLQAVAYIQPDGALAPMEPGSKMPALDVIPPAYILKGMQEKYGTGQEVWEHHVSEYIDNARTFVYTALLTLSFMHCRNVVYSDVPPTAQEREVARKRRQAEPITYKVLELTPFRPSIRHSVRQGEAHPAGPKSLHIVRGSFATYDEKPLFGRVRGTFWRPMTLRGSLEAGIVVKDYSLNLTGKQP